MAADGRASAAWSSMAVVVGERELTSRGDDGCIRGFWHWLESLLRCTCRIVVVKLNESASEQVNKRDTLS